jgi:hypothetical protein
MIGMIGLIVLAVFVNIMYYEYRVIKTPKKDVNIMSGYLDLYRRKYDRRKF